MIRVEVSMLGCSGGVLVVIGGFNKETIYKAVFCVIVTSLSNKCCICWNI